MVSAFSSSVESLPDVVVSGPVAVPLAETLDQQASGFAGLNVQQLAAEGYFQAIAYWLNEPLVPQNVYAQVLADRAAGCIKVLVEFERVPQPRRLLKFVCDRIYKLNSNVIEGLYLIARKVGSATTEWEQRIRIPTATQRQLKSQSITSPITLADTSPSVTPSSAAPSLAAPSSAVQNPSAAKGVSPKIVHESSRSKIAREVVRSQFKFFRAALISGSATAAFLFGGLTELLLSDRLSPSIATEPAPAVAPWYDEAPDATEVAFHASQRTGRTVEASLETVAVIPHTEVAQPDDPTITLLFGGELGLNDFIFEEAESLDRLFADLNIYQQADVAMVGLSEPLATASTSLQEDFYHRTRPQAVKALKAGGIDIVNLASEGTLTHGSRGLDETLVTLDRQGIYRVGAGRNQLEAHRPEILEVKGQRIAYLGYNPEAIKAAKDDKAGVALTNSKERLHILEDIRAIRPQVDWVVVNYRWGDVLGTEQADESDTSSSDGAFAAIPEEWQQSLAHDAVDAGADLVVGYHPSQIQGAEIYRDRAIAYSLGDFVFGEAPLEDHDTAALRVSLRNHQMKVEFLPVSIRDSQLQMATGEHGTAILQGIRNASKPFEQPLRFPVVLKAPPIHTPQPDPVPFSPETLTPAETSPAFIEPIPTHLIPEEFRSPELAPERYSEEAVPAPIMRESEALFPMEDPASPLEALPAQPVLEDDMPLPVSDLEPDRLEPDRLEPDRLEPDRLESDRLELDTSGLLPVSNPSSLETTTPVMLERQENTGRQSIEAYEEPLVGPLSVLPTYPSVSQN